MFVHSHYVTSLSESSFYSSISPACLTKKKKEKPQNYLLVSPGNCLGLPGFFKTSFFAFTFFIMRRIKSRFNVLWDFLSVVSVKVWKGRLLLFSCVIFSWVTFILSWWWNEAIAFVARAFSWPVWDYFYSLFLSPLILRGSRSTRSHHIAWSSAAPFQLIPKRSLDQLNCSVASSISYWTSISLTSVGAGENLNWILWR